MPRDPGPQPPPSILIVDDNADARRLLALLLRAEGYRLLIAREGYEALRIAERVPHLALVLLDIMMPGIDGLEVCRRLRSRHSEGYLPIVLATALSDRDNVAEGLAAGADDYVTKPFVRAEVLSRVRAALRLKRATDELLAARELAAVGAMAATLGHEINNPLTTVVGNLALVRRNASLDGEARSCIEAAHQASLRIQELVERLVKIRKVTIAQYVGPTRMLDVQRSCPAGSPAENG